VAIIDAAETLRTEAANAFLKTLEEPPDGTVIVLVASGEENLPDTVRSRCQRVAFERVDRDTLIDALEQRGAETARAEALAALAGGRAGWALRALSDEALLGERSEALENAVRLAHASRAERFAWARGGDERGMAARERFQKELGYWESW